MATAVSTSLYERLGGQAAVTSVVKDFYRRVLADDMLKGYFDGVDMPRQERSQIDFLSMALGGPNSYKGKSMRDAHNGLGITALHFDLVAGHLVDTLKGAGVPAPAIEEVVALVGPLKAEIVTC